MPMFKQEDGTFLIKPRQPGGEPYRTEQAHKRRREAADRGDHRAHDAGGENRPVLHPESAFSYLRRIPRIGGRLGDLIGRGDGRVEGDGRRFALEIDLD